MAPHYAGPVDARYSTFTEVRGDQHNHTTIHLPPRSCLAPAVSSYELIVSAIQKAQTSGQQMSVLAECAFKLLQTLKAEYQAGRLVESETSAPLEDLNRYVVAVNSAKVYSSCYPGCSSRF
jgi:hypothetical protein